MARVYGRAVSMYWCRPLQGLAPILACERRFCFSLTREERDSAARGRRVPVWLDGYYSVGKYLCGQGACALSAGLILLSFHAISYDLDYCPPLLRSFFERPIGCQAEESSPSKLCTFLPLLHPSVRPSLCPTRRPCQQVASMLLDDLLAPGEK